MINRVVYIKADQEIKVSKTKLLLEDVLKVRVDDADVEKKIKELPFFELDGTEEKKYVFSVLGVVERIQKAFPDCIVNNLGESEFIVDYIRTRKTVKPLRYAKIIFVCLVAFFGAIFSIMTFNMDVGVNEVFAIIYKMFGASEVVDLKIVEIGYSLGIPIGITVFFNHFSRSRLRYKPSPLHVEVRNYEQEVNQAFILDASREGNVHDEL
ncbi:MAG: stage V sporulation protein AA [Lachnospiraceae bacterium]|nr:stage V sporulation protein AA [Lachnospiraceae bacterium]